MNIAITGGIGSGKSTIIAELTKVCRNSVGFYSVDRILDDMYKNDVLWKSYLVDTLGTCDKTKLRAMAFSNASAKDFLVRESALHVGVMLGKILTSKEHMVNIIEFPLLFESRMQNHFDKTVLITADKDIRIQRVADRDNTSPDEVRRIIDLQWSDEKKKALASIIIDTSTAPVKECVDELLWLI